MDDLTGNFLFKAIVYVIPMILSLSVHEFFHARVAYALGDDTASRLGRMTLNPLSHIDILGTLVIPIVAMLSGGLPLIGWAKPVPVSPIRFTRRLSMRAGMMLVAVAGPASNGALAALSLIAFRLVFGGHPLGVVDSEGTTLAALSYLLLVMVNMNLGLMVFNLIPIPPLDGSRLLPRRFDPILERILPYSYMILMGVMYFLGGLLYIPIQILLLVASLAIGIPLA